MRKIYIILIAAYFLQWGCSDFLSVNPQSELTQESFPLSSSDALQATNAIYSSLRDWHYHSGGFPILDIMSDETTARNDGTLQKRKS